VLGKSALAAHDKVLGRHHRYTTDSADVMAGALDALGRNEEALSLREAYGLTDDNSKPEQAHRRSGSVPSRSMRTHLCLLLHALDTLITDRIHVRTETAARGRRVASRASARRAGSFGR
jgi:hypothetical protein